MPHVKSCVECNNVMKKDDYRFMTERSFSIKLTCSEACRQTYDTKRNGLRREMKRSMDYYPYYKMDFYD